MGVAPVFTLADVRDLARNPNADLTSRRKPREAGRRGFPFPQQRWVYEAAAAYYAEGRDPKALVRTLNLALERGAGITRWKREVRRSLGALLEAVVTLEEAADGRFVGSAYRYPIPTVEWRRHRLRVPLGLIFQVGETRAVRMLWIERSLQAESRGVTLAAAATLAASGTLGRIDAIETWHLRDAEHRRFTPKDLQLALTQLDP